jgi:hypothetical protein
MEGLHFIHQNRKIFLWDVYIFFGRMRQPAQLSREPHAASIEQLIGHHNERLETNKPQQSLAYYN